VRRHPVWLLYVLVPLLAACATPPVPAAPAQATPDTIPFRSKRFHLEVALPLGWAAAEGPEYLARPFTGLVAFNSWDRPGFWAPEVRTANGATYGPQGTLGQVPAGEAYVALIHFSGGPPRLASEYGPEYEPGDLHALWGQRDCREAGGATWTDFSKWGRLLRLEVYCRPDASDATAAAVDDLLASWRFDRVPAGDPGWASVQARSLLPTATNPDEFPILSNLPVEGVSLVSSESSKGAARTTRVELHGDTVILTFQYHWDDPDVGWSGDECPPGRCHWWRFEALPSGEVVLTDEGGAGLPVGGE
jgi:hypothetical protein